MFSLFSHSKLDSPFAKAALGLFGFAVLAILSFSCQPRNSSESARMTTENSSEAGFEVRFQAMDGTEIPFSPEKKKWTVLHFWATTCKPCLEEFPKMKMALPKLESDSVEFILATEESLAQIKAYEEKHQTGLDLVRMSRGDLSDFEIYALPTTLIYDGQGEVVYTKVGLLDWNSFHTLEDIWNKAP